MPAKYAVIFKAEIISRDDNYYLLASSLRKLAFENYNCIDFISLHENGKEISISYWNSLDDIEKWKNDSEHKNAKEKGKSIWYKSFSVEIVKLIKENHFASSYNPSTKKHH